MFTFPRGRKGGQVGMCWLSGIKAGRLRSYVYIWMPAELLLFCVDAQTFQHSVTDSESHSSCFANCSCDSFSMVVYLEVVVGCFFCQGLCLSGACSHWQLGWKFPFLLLAHYKSVSWFTLPCARFLLMSYPFSALLLANIMHNLT